jgi:site-specific DNA recombinase
MSKTLNQTNASYRYWFQAVEMVAPLRVVLYARVSGEEQGDPLSGEIPAQVNDLKEWAISLGWQIVVIYEEIESGANRNRPKLQYALEMLEAKEADALVVHDLSRLARSTVFTLEIFEKLIKLKALFISKRESHYDFRNADDLFFLTILAATHEHSLALLKTHTSKGKRDRARRGLYNASVVPFGYQHSGNKEIPPTVVEKEARIVELAAERYAEGIYSDHQVAEWLNIQGYRTRKGGYFTADILREMLQNPFYIGRMPYRRRRAKSEEEYEGRHPAILRQELWDRCQQARAARRTSGRTQAPVYRAYLLSDLAVCDVCGRKLRAQAQGQQGQLTYYREASADRGYKDCPHQHTSIRTEVVDEQMQALVNALKLPQEWSTDLGQKLREDESIQHQQKLREQYERELSQIRHTEQKGRYQGTPEALERDYARVEAELAKLPSRRELEQMLAVFETPESFQAEWQQSSALDQRDLLRLMLTEVRVDISTGRVVSLTPFDAFVPLFRCIPGIEERAGGEFVLVRMPTTRHPVSLIELPDLKQVTKLPAISPFFTQLPALADDRVRIAPGLSDALTRCRESDRNPRTLVQVESAYVQPLPADVRKWKSAKASVMTMESVLQRADASIDVLASYLWGWDQWVMVGQAEKLNILMAEAYRLLMRGGVWYGVDVLPSDLPTHWLGRFFEADEWMEKVAKIPSLLELNVALQNAGFVVTMKRRVYAQPVQLGAILQIAEQRQGLLAQMPDEIYTAGLGRLRQAVASEGANTVQDSQVALLEWWAQKPMTQEVDAEES